MTIAVRAATPPDVALILRFIVELAIYERLEDEVEATEADIHELIFGERPAAGCEIVEADGEAVGFALWFYSVSTFKGRRGLYLEDLYVREAYRGRGAGLALLKALARRCREERLGRMEWAVLDWNAPSIAFYDSLGSAALDDWTTRRLTGEALVRLAD